MTDPLHSGLTSAIHVLPVAMLVAEKDGRVVEVNRAWTELTGLDRRSSAAWGWSSVMAPEEQSRLLNRLLASEQRSDPSLGDYPLQIAGDHRWSRWTVRWFGDDPLAIMVVLDIDADRIRVEALRRAATLDSLTGLVNRAELMQLAAEALEHAGSTVGMCYVDLDSFKAVNDHAGHLLGDHVLAAAAARLATAVRPGDVVARVGGDEFAVLLPDTSETTAVARRLSRSLADPILAGGVQWRIGATVGVATAQPGQTAEELLDAADRAMYAAKSASRNPVQSQRASMHVVGGIRTEFAEMLIHQIFAVGLTISSASTLEGAAAADRLARAVDDLDCIIAWVRSSTTQTSPTPTLVPSSRPEPPASPGQQSLSERISILANQLDVLARPALQDGQDSIHLLDASYSLHRALIALTAEPDTVVDQSMNGTRADKSQDRLVSSANPRNT